MWTHRVESLFLDAFGRPDPNQDPPCERTGDTTMVQALHLMNSPELHHKVTNDDESCAGSWPPAPSRREKSSKSYICWTYCRLSDGGGSCRDHVPLFSESSAESPPARPKICCGPCMNTPEFVFKD